MILVTRAVSLILLLLGLGTSIFGQDVLVLGTILEQGTAEPLADVLVSTQDGSSSALTDVDGNFELKVTKTPGILVIAIEGFRQNELVFPKATSELVRVGTIFLVPVPTALQPDDERTYDGGASQSDGTDFGASATVSSLLTASRDPFQQAAAFNFSAARFRIRGYENRYNTAFFNGAPANDPEANRAFFFLWGGLNDVTRNRNNSIGLGFNSFDPSALGGVGDIDVRAGSQREVSRVSFANSNRSWQYRGMATHNTGWLQNDWAFSVSGSVSYADEGYIPGTYQQAFSYFLGVDRRFGESNKHRLSLNVLAAPSLRGGAGSSVQEAYDIAGTNYYNPNWGFQAGEIRNAREYRTNQPVVSLTHEWNPNYRTNWKTSFFGVTGRNGQTRLERDGAPNPIGTYYQYLPSFSLNTESAAAAEAALRENPDRLQIDWDNIYAINRRQRDVIENADGIEGNTRTGAQARYWIEEQRSDPTRLSFASRFRHALSPQITFHGGVLGDFSSVHNYKIVDDLLGADFVLDINQFAVRDLGSVAAAQNNVNKPNGIITEGDKFGWDYDSRVFRQQAFTQVEYVGRLFDVNASISIANEDHWRVGYVQNGQFPDNSLGESEKQNFLTGAARIGVTHKINGRNYIQFNAMRATKAPDYRDVLVSPRTRNEFAPNLKPETITSAELGYQFRAPNFKAQLTGYYTQFEDRLRNIRFFIETADNATGFGSYVLQGMNSEHLGLEAAFEYDITSSLEVNGALAIGRYQYTSRPTANAFIDNSGVQLVEDETIYLKNFYVGQTPQQAGSLSLRYQGKQYYTISLTGSYTRYAFTDFGPLRRTKDAVRNLTEGSQEVLDIIDQEQLPSAFTMDLFVTKSMKFNGKFLYFTAGVNNLLNNTGIISGAREQLRYDFESQDVNRFPNQYFYAYGTNYFAQVAFQF